MAKDSGNEKYAYLNRLSTEQLEELLRADFESLVNGDTDVIFYILEVMKEREEESPTGRIPNVDKAWGEFQQYYNIPEGEGCCLYPTVEDNRSECPADEQVQSTKMMRLRPAFKLAGLVAAIIVGIFGLMVTAQAAGIDVFGAIGRWTEETFHFVSSASGAVPEVAQATLSPENISYYNSLQTALEECGITEDLAPTWYPEGAVAIAPKILHDDVSSSVDLYFSVGEKNFFSINITHYQSAADLDSVTFEKDSISVEQYVSGAKTFYILSNMDTITAIWSNGLLMESISGNLTMDKIKAIINSIGG